MNKKPCEHIAAILTAMKQNAVVAIGEGSFDGVALYCAHCDCTIVVGETTR